jgi:hypothetical protein
VISIAVTANRPKIVRTSIVPPGRERPALTAHANESLIAREAYRTATPTSSNLSW